MGAAVDVSLTKDTLVASSLAVMGHKGSVVGTLVPVRHESCAGDRPVGTAHVSVVPSPGDELTVRVPPTCCARSRMLRRPDIRVGSPMPTPLSETVSTTWSVTISDTVVEVALACLATLVSASPSTAMS